MDKSESVRALAEETLADIELSRLPVEQLVFKAARLARLADHQELMVWLAGEMHGYADNDVGEKYMTLTGRWTDKAERKGY